MQITPMPCRITCRSFRPPLPPCSQGGLGSSKQQLEALLAARCGYPQAALAARALAGFACASLQEDRFGVLQLTQVGGCATVLWPPAPCSPHTAGQSGGRAACLPLTCFGAALAWCWCWQGCLLYDDGDG